MVHGKIHKGWNLVFFPFSSWALSHFNTKSPTLKFLFPANFLSNQHLIWLWWIEIFSFSLILYSSRLRRVSILLWTRIQGFPWDSCERRKAGRKIFSVRITSFSYTRKYGEVFREGLGVTQLAHNAFIKALCQSFFLEKTIFLIILIRFLFVDLDKNFPYG